MKECMLGFEGGRLCQGRVGANMSQISGKLQSYAGGEGELAHREVSVDLGWGSELVRGGVHNDGEQAQHHVDVNLRAQ